MPAKRLSAIAPRLAAFAHRLKREKRGNVLMIFGFSLVPLVFAAGMGIDYSRAMKLQTKLNAIADAAALSAVTQPMMLQPDSTAKTTATNMFNAQAAGLPDLVYDPSSLVVTITTVPGATPGRTATISYRALSNNAFAGVLGQATLTIQGTASANATKAPYIDFYLLLDTSPSMLLPSTSVGLSQMRTLTTTSHLGNGCAFACHTQNPHTDNVYIRNKNGKDIWLDSSAKPYFVDKVSNGNIYYTNAQGQSVQGPKESAGRYADSYWLAYHAADPGVQVASSPITMRIDAEQEAVQDLIPFAYNTASTNKVSYRMAVNRFDYGPNNAAVVPLTTLTSGNLASLATQTSNLPMTMWYSNSNITSSNNIDDQSTDFQTAFKNMDSLIPNPGTGATAQDPQAILFIVTDGMSDENLNGRTHRELQPTHISQCNALKKRNIQIAILYTEYLPGSLTGDSWSQSNVAPYLPNIEPALQACASSGLYYKVTTDQSISDALTALFARSVASAHLVQ